MERGCRSLILSWLLPLRVSNSETGSGFSSGTEDGLVRTGSSGNGAMAHVRSCLGKACEHSNVPWGKGPCPLVGARQVGSEGQ